MVTAGPNTSLALLPDATHPALLASLGECGIHDGQGILALNIAHVPDP